MALPSAMKLISIMEVRVLFTKKELISSPLRVENKRSTVPFVLEETNRYPFGLNLSREISK
jgi:hypothetical protein